MMTEALPSRRSGRQRVPNQKYTNDAFEGLEIFSSESEEELAALEQLQDAEDDEDFPEDQVADEPEDDDSLVEEASDGSAILTPVEEYEDAHSYASTDGDEPLSPESAKRKARNHATYRDPNIRSRGLPENPFRQDGQRSRLKLFAGEGEEDILHLITSRDQWATDATLPRRSALCQSFSRTEANSQMEATVGWDWYYGHGGRNYFSKQQSFHSLTEDEAAEYIPKPNRTNHTFLMGSYGRQRPFTLSYSQSIGLEAAWSEASAGQEAEQESRQRTRHGWMLNIGARVRCLEWAPNHDGKTQYLAIAIAPLNDSIAKDPFKESPSYTPCSSKPSAIQIWAFAANENPHTGSSLTPNQAPELRLIIVSDWGEVKHMKWCPVPRASRNENHQQSTSLNIGLLAGVWGDGFVRVLDVDLDKTETNQVRKYESAAFAACPADTLSTCLTWLSPTDLAVGHTNGLLAVYDIYSQPSLDHQIHHKQANQEPTSPTTPEITAKPIPWLAVLLHNTYILSLTTAYPTHPSLLASSSLSGHVRLTSLVAPTTDFVYSVRTRTPPASLAYYDPLLSMVGIEECSETMRAWGLRCFYASLGFGRMASPPGPGPGMIDVGRCHASIAVGGADGGVIVTNPLRKTLGRKEKGYQQCVFKHEWVRQPTQAGDAEAGERNGMSRVTEGYKGEKADVDVHKKRDHPRNRGTVLMTTIYEEETAVTALAWNPNLTCGAWLAVGWGSGLLRVQDLAI